MTSTKASRLKDDLCEAQKKFIGTTECTSLEEEDGALAINVRGYGDFTAFLPDPYPGPTTVYGPDDFELDCEGGINEIVVGLLDKLQNGLGRTCTASSGADVVMHHDLADLAGPTIMEPLLEQHLAQAQRLLSKRGVQCDEMTMGWRIRLEIPLKSFQPHDEGQCLISTSMGAAWGLDPDIPITVELICPLKGYHTPEALTANFVNAVFQQNYPNFLLEKQLIRILSDFTSSAFGAPLPLGGDGGDADMNLFNDGERELAQEALLRKTMLISAAQAETELGFLGHLAVYLQLRIVCMHEFCALCDRPFGLPPMFMRTVCRRQLCAHQFQAFGAKITSAQGVNTQGEIAELLALLLAKAVSSHRRDLVLTPYPCVYGGQTSKEAVLHPSNKQKDLKVLTDTIAEVLSLRKREGPRLGAAWTGLKTMMSPTCAGLMQWVVASNRTYLAPLNDRERIEALGTQWQYILISSPPEKERVFQKLKETHGAIFAFHGSDVGNWHSILRNGLKNASGTALMSAGQSYGPGIYLGSSSGISFAYSGVRLESSRRPSRAEADSSGVAASKQPPGNRCIAGGSEDFKVLALCEVVQHPSLRTYDWGYVAPQEDTVCTRFLLLYDTQAHKDIALTEKVVKGIRRCMAKLQVGAGANLGEEEPGDDVTMASQW